MSDIDSAIKASKKYEHLLQSLFNAEGKGLHEKASSVSSIIHDDIIKKLRFIASIRNKIVHEENYEKIDDIDNFNTVCVELDNYFEKNQENNIQEQDTTDKKTEVNWVDVIRNYPSTPSNPKEILAGKGKTIEIIAEWEKCSGKRFVPTADCMHEVNKWFKVIANFTLMSQEVMRAGGEFRFIFNSPEVTNNWEFHKHVTPPSPYIQEIYNVIRKSAKNDKRIKKVTHGIDWDGKESICISHTTPNLYIGMFNKLKIDKLPITSFYTFDNFFETTINLTISSETAKKGNGEEVEIEALQSISHLYTEEEDVMKNLTVKVPKDLDLHTGDEIRMKDEGMYGKGDLFIKLHIE